MPYTRAYILINLTDQGSAYLRHDAHAITLNSAGRFSRSACENAKYHEVARLFILIITTSEKSDTRSFTHRQCCLNVAARGCKMSAGQQILLARVSSPEIMSAKFLRCLGAPRRDTTPFFALLCTTSLRLHQPRWARTPKSHFARMRPAGCVDLRVSRICARGTGGLKNVNVQLSPDNARLMEFLRGRLGANSRGSCNFRTLRAAR